MVSSKTATERAVALAFPTLVGDDSASLADDELSVLSDDDFLLDDGGGGSPTKKNRAEKDALLDRAAGDDDEEMPWDEAISGNGKNSIIPNDGKGNEYLLDAEVPSTPETMITTAHSEWWTPPARRRHRINPNQPQQQPPSNKMNFGDVLFLSIIVFVLATCVAAMVVVVLRGEEEDFGNRLGGLAGDSSDSSSPPVAAPTMPSPIVERYHRLEAIRAWLPLDDEDDFPSPHSAQGAALDFMVISDLGYILGATIPSKADYDLYQQQQQQQQQQEQQDGTTTNLNDNVINNNSSNSNSNSNNNSSSSVYIDSEHQRLALFDIHVTQRYALLVWAFATGMGSPYGGWATFTGARLHECLWPGVHCRRGDESVKALNFVPSILGYNFVPPRGPVPKELGLMRNLEKLFLSDNQLTGELPSELYNLSKLYALQFSYTHLDSTLSSDIAKLERLEFLDLTNSGFRGPIPSELGSLTNLKFLFFADNNFSSTVPSELGNLVLLEKLAVQQNLLSGQMPQRICDVTNSDRGRLQTLTANCQPTITTGSAPNLTHNPGFVDCGCCTECF